MKLKFSSLCHLHCWITIWTPYEFQSLLSFHGWYQWIPSSSLGHFLSLKKTIKRNMFFSQDKCISKIHYYHKGKQSPNFVWAGCTWQRFSTSREQHATRRTGNIKQIHLKYLTNFCKNYFLTLHWNVSSQWLQNYELISGLWAKLCAAQQTKLRAKGGT